MFDMINDAINWQMGAWAGILAVGVLVCVRALPRKWDDKSGFGPWL